jgi:hypothetical protein
LSGVAKSLENGRVLPVTESLQSFAGDVGYPLGNGTVLPESNDRQILLKGVHFLL